MSKRFLLILFFVLPLAIFMVVAWRAHHAHQLLIKKGFVAVTTGSNMLALLDIEGGITPSEIQDATNTLVQERQMWSQFNGIIGDINVEFEGNDESHLLFGGNVSLRRVDLLPTDDTNLVAKYEMTISDKQGGWTVTTDGTSRTQ